MNDPASVPSADAGAPDSTRFQRERPPASRLDAVLVGLAVAAYGVTVALAYFVFDFPQVRRLSWALGVACLGFVAVAVLVARSRGARALVLRGAVPLLALVVGWACVAAVVTWSFPASKEGVFILALLVVADVFLVVLSLIALAWNRNVGILALLVIALLWVPVLVAPSETTVRRLRVKLAAPSLVAEGKRVLDEPSTAKDMGPFIAYDESSDARVVGWLNGVGLLGRGPGLVWDPEAVLRGSGSAHTDDGYPWWIRGVTCEQIVDDLLYCDLR